MSKGTKSDQRGAVAIFVVIFTALLVTVISVSFIRLMIQAQQQAVASDLSQSAYDSALAGIEDAKRLLVKYERECKNSAAPAEQCATLERLLRVDIPCNTIQQSGLEGDPEDDEVLIKRSEGDEALNQAYTCVKVNLETNDYVGIVNRGNNRIIPLKGTGNFNEVVLEWYSQVDLQNSADVLGEQIVSLEDISSGMLLPKLEDWPSDRPSVMRAHLMQFGESFTLSDFDKTDDGISNAHTVFLYPLRTGRDTVDFAEDLRMSQSSGILHPVNCDEDFSTASTDKTYACRIVLKLPDPVGGDSSTRSAYLRIDPVYNHLTHFSVQLQNDGEIVKFRDVQPIVDSTGRANDLFRRVQSRVELHSSFFAYPEGAVDVTGNLCKTFLVTDKSTDYDSGLCDPRG